jgi:biofilm PGA synthesis N-glycosyltransferase PgaC
MNPFIEVMIYVVAFSNVLGMLHLGLFVTGANAYDVKQMRAKKAALKLAAKAEKKRKSPYRPLISVVVPAHNEEVGILRTLDSLQQSTYTRTEIIVVDDGSTDRTSPVVRRYVSHTPPKRVVSYMARRSGRDGQLTRRLVHTTVRSLPVTLVRQKNGGKGSAVNNGIQNHSKGSLIMTLDADSTLQPTAIASAVSYFKDKRIVGVAANVRVMGRGWLGMLQRFEHMIGYRSKKFYTMANCEFIVGGVASTYRKSILKQVGYYDTDTQTEDIGLSMKIVSKIGNTDKRIIYASDVVAMTEGVQTYKALIKQRYRWKLGSLQNLYKYRQMIFARGDKLHSRTLRFYRLPMAVLGELMLLLEPLMMSYIIYLSISRQSIGIFLGAYLTITLYTLWTIWPDEHMTTKQKLQMSLNSLVIYLLFYSMTLVQLLAIFKAVKNYNKIYDLSNQSNTWVSPKRALKPQVAV